MFSIVTVASSTRIPTASARPPRVMMLSVSPSAYRTKIDDRIDSGIETAMMQVLRQLPRNSRISAAVRPAAISASRTTPLMAARTKTDWSNSGVILMSLGRSCASAGNCASNALDDVEGRGAAVLEHRQQHAALAVLAHDVGLRRKSVAHVGDFATDRSSRRFG